MRVVSVGKIIATLFLLFGLSLPMFGQRMHYFDLRKFNLGFSLGMNSASYWVSSQPNQLGGKPQRLLKNIELINKPGINIGLLTNTKLGDHWDFRFFPSVSLEQRDFDFFFESRISPNDSVVRKKVEASYMNIPFALKFKSDFHKVYRLYVMTGMQYSLNLASSKKIRNDPNLIKTDSYDISAFIAIGMDLYGEKLKLAPEIRYHLGLNNLYISDNTYFPAAISELFSSTVVFTINFE
jgi:Outer membrane protein beta-barrel domain